MAINRTFICGNLVRDPEVRYENKSQKACARVTVALNRGRSSSGEDLGADYPQAVFWGGPAEYIEKNARKGMLIAIEGRIRTGSYESKKTGKKIYIMEIAGEKVQLFRAREEGAAKKEQHPDAPSALDLTGNDDWSSQTRMEGFEQADDIPF